MNKKAIYNFLKKLNTTKTYKGLADFVIENLTKLTKAQACWIGLINYTTMIVEVKKIYKTDKTFWIHYGNMSWFKRKSMEGTDEVCG